MMTLTPTLTTPTLTTPSLALMMDPLYRRLLCQWQLRILLLLLQLQDQLVQQGQL